MYEADLLPDVDPGAEVRIMLLLIAKHPDEARQALAEAEIRTVCSDLAELDGAE